MEFHVSRDGVVLGQGDASTIWERLQAGEYCEEDLYWRKGMLEWSPLSDFVRRQNFTPEIKSRKFKALVVKVASLCVVACAGALIAVLVMRQRPSKEPLPSPSSLVVENKEPQAPAAVPVPQRENLKPEEIYKQLAGSVVLVRSLDKDGNPESFGSGFAIEDGSRIATNLHVIKGAERLEIVFDDGAIESPTVESASLDEMQDVAILRVFKHLKPINWAQNPPTIGNTLYAIGNPHGLQRSLSQGLLSGIREEKGLSFYQMTTPISPGSSGGPIVNDKGEAVGMATFCHKDGQSLNFAVRYVEIQDQLAGKAKTVSRKIPERPNLERSLGMRVEVVSEDEGSVVLSVTNDLKQPIRAIMVRLMYFQMPPEVETPGFYQAEIARRRKGIVELEAGLSEAAQEASSLAKTRNLFEVDAESISIEQVAKWKGLQFAGDTQIKKITLFNCIWTAQTFLDWRASSNPFTRRAAQDKVAELRREIAFVISEIDAKKAEIISVRVKVEGTIYETKASLKSLEKAAIQKSMAWPKVLSEARKKIMHYEDFPILAEFAPQLVKRIVVKAATSPRAGIIPSIIDYSTYGTTLGR